MYNNKIKGECIAEVCTSEARQLLALAIPVKNRLRKYMAQTAMGFVDTDKAGAMAATDMAAVYPALYLASTPFCLVTAYCWP